MPISNAVTHDIARLVGLGGRGRAVRAQAAGDVGRGVFDGEEAGVVGQAGVEEGAGVGAG